MWQNCNKIIAKIYKKGQPKKTLLDKMAPICPILKSWCLFQYLCHPIGLFPEVKLPKMQWQILSVWPRTRSFLLLLHFLRNLWLSSRPKKEMDIDKQNHNNSSKAVALAYPENRMCYFLSNAKKAPLFSSHSLLLIHTLAKQGKSANPWKKKKFLPFNFFLTKSCSSSLP